MRRARCGVASRRATDLDGTMTCGRGGSSTSGRFRKLEPWPSRSPKKAVPTALSWQPRGVGGTEARALTAPRSSLVLGVDCAVAMNDFESMDLDGDGTLSYAVRVRPPRPVTFVSSPGARPDRFDEMSSSHSVAAELAPPSVPRPPPRALAGGSRRAPPTRHRDLFGAARERPRGARRGRRRARQPRRVRGVREAPARADPRRVPRVRPRRRRPRHVQGAPRRCRARGSQDQRRAAPPRVPQDRPRRERHPVRGGVRAHPAPPPGGRQRRRSLRRISPSKFRRRRRGRIHRTQGSTDTRGKRRGVVGRARGQTRRRRRRGRRLEDRHRPRRQDKDHHAIGTTPRRDGDGDGDGDGDEHFCDDVHGGDGGARAFERGASSSRASSAPPTLRSAVAAPCTARAARVPSGAETAPTW